MDCHTPGFLVLHYLPEFAQTHVHWVSDGMQPSHPLSSPFPSAFYLSQQQGLFQWVNSSHQVAKVLATQLQHSPSNEYSGFSFFKIGLISLKSKGLSRVFSNTTVQNINSFMPSLLYGPTLTFINDYWKTIALTMWTFVSKVMSFLFNMLSRFVIAFLPKSKHLYIPWLQSPSAVIL